MTHPGAPFGDRGNAASAPGFGRGAALAGVVIVALVLGGLVWSAASGRPASAEKPHFFGGSLVLEDARPPTVIDVATAQITVRLEGVDAQVGAANYSDVQAVPVRGGTMLVNRRSGSFNFLEEDNYVADPSGPGVGLGKLTGARAAEGFASGSDAYVVRSAPRSTVSLVGPQTVSAAARIQASRKAGVAASVSPLGFARFGGTVSLQPGSAAVAGSSLWALVANGSACSAYRVSPAPTSRQGLVTTRPVPESAPCAEAALEAAPGMLGLADPGHVRFLEGASSAAKATVAVRFTAAATRILPVTGSAGEVWFLARVPSGWVLFAASPSGRVSGPYPLTRFAGSADPAVPVYSNGFLYTLDRASVGQPTLWAIDAANGHMAPVSGAPSYPARTPAERASFESAQVLVDGPRVVFNNPQSLEAVVVFTDGSHAPVVIDKSEAVALSTTGPADLDLSPPTTKPGTKPGGSQTHSVPVVQPVSQQVTCANTTQKPYAPQVTSVSVSSGTALIAWSYELLDQSDCEPDSWAVHVTAVSGGHQPAQPIQTVDGQSQYLFTGLRPATTYEATVTAYINAQFTPSTPVTFTTSARGPDAPLSVSTQSDGKGDWVVSWTPCTEAANPACVVPAAEWTVVGAACAGSFVATAPTVQVPGNQDSVTIDSDGLGLLGDSLSFTVQGSLVSGLTGNPTPDHSCTEAWRAPDPSAITLGAAGQQQGGTITAVLSVSATGNPVEAFGALPADTDLVYHLGGAVIGPTTKQSVTVPGLLPGQQYTPSVTVYPAGHPGAGVTVTGQPFSQTLPWPADLVGGITVTPSVDQDNPDSGTLTVGFPPDLPPGSQTQGLAITCASTEVPLSDPQPALGGRSFTEAMNLAANGGSCSLSLTLVDAARPDPYGGPSAKLTAAFTIGTQPGYTFSDRFTHDYGKLEVDSTNGGVLAGDNWTVSTSSAEQVAGTDLCATSVAVPLDKSGDPQFPVDVDVPQTCLDPSGVTVTVSYRYLGQTVSTSAGGPQGPPPTTTTTTTTTTTSVPASTTLPCATSTTAGSTTAPCGSAAPAASGASLSWVALLLFMIWPGTPLIRRLRRKDRTST